MAKNNNFWIKLIIGISITLLVFAVGYGVLNQKVERNCEDIVKHEVKIEKQDAKIDKNENTIIEQGNDLKHIRKTVDRIEKKM